MSDIEILLDVARSQLGVQESPKGSNNVKYNTWYYGREVYDGLWGTTFPWCMVFVQWCFAQMNKPLPYKTASCSALLNWYKQNDLARIQGDPKPGDIIIYSFGHTGILESAASGTVTAIEGNTGTSSANNGGEVMRQTRSKKLVTAYIRALDDEEPVMDYETWKKYMQRFLDEQSAQPVPSWGIDELETAESLGITNGERPMAWATRLEAALMAKRAYEARGKE